MTTKRRKFFAIVLLGVIGGVVAYGLLNRNDEPKYHDRYLSEWLERYTDPSFEPGSAEVAEAEIAVRNIGTNAFPCFMKWIATKSKPSAWRTTLKKNLPTFLTTRASVINWLEAEERRCYYAHMGLRLLETNAVSIIPELLAIVKGTPSFDDRYEAASALASIGESALPALKAALANPHRPDDRHQILYTISMMADRHGKDCLPVLMPVLIEALNDDDFEVRYAATNAISDINAQFFTDAPSQ